MAYIWIRFGNLKYGTATVVALLHDMLFTIAALGFAHLLANNWFGDLLKLEPFRINLTVVAGILTIMGYSMIDTIVVFDRIRENRGKYGHVSRQVINDAVNQTLSRTLLTAGTTTIMVVHHVLPRRPGDPRLYIRAAGWHIGRHLLLGRDRRPDPAVGQRGDPRTSPGSARPAAQCGDRAEDLNHGVIGTTKVARRAARREYSEVDTLLDSFLTSCPFVPHSWINCLLCRPWPAENLKNL